MSVTEPVITPARSKFKVDPDAPRLVIGLPVRKTTPIEFLISMEQKLAPLNVRMSYCYQKGADCKQFEIVEDLRAVQQARILESGATDVVVCHACGGGGRLRITGQGKLPAAARNAILQTALTHGIEFCLFLDDDVLYPEMAIQRLWVQMAKHPEAACITGIYTSKSDPAEPLLYADDRTGAYWDWALGDLVPIHSAGAGIMLVRMSAVAQLEPPWFNDVVVESKASTDAYIQRNTWGHDRYFHMRLREETGGVIYADTGLLCSHWDSDLQKNYIMPPDAPCFQRPLAGEAFVPYLDEQGVVQWRRMVPHKTAKDDQFRGWLDWIGRLPTGRDVQQMIPAPDFVVETPA